MQALARWVPAARLAALAAEPLTYLLLLFAASRYGARLAGVSFDIRPLDTSWHIIDPLLLRTDLVRSVFYLHGQPPLYNLFLGLVLKLSPDPAVISRAFSLIYMVMGLLFTILVYRLLRRLGAAQSTSFLVTALFMLSPAVILYENIPYYTYPVAVLLCVCALYFHKMVSGFRFVDALVLFMTMAVLIHTRSLFQIQWFVVLAMYALWAMPGNRRQILAAAAVPFLLVVLLYAKNGVIIGHFATSSWLGMSFSKVATLPIELSERHAMVRAQVLSPLALKRPYRPPERYPFYTARAEANPTGVPVLDRQRKSTGHINFNYIAYVGVSDQYLEDALVALKTHPLTYLTTMGTAYQIFFRPSGQYKFLVENRSDIESWTRFFNLFIAGQPVYVTDPSTTHGGPGSIAYFTVAGFIICILWGSVLAYRFLVLGERRPVQMTLLFLWMNIVYVTVLGNAFEIGENQRFRFLINAFLSIMLGVLGDSVWRNRGAGLFRTPTSGTGCR